MFSIWESVTPHTQNLQLWLKAYASLGAPGQQPDLYSCAACRNRFEVQVKAVSTEQGQLSQSKASIEV